MEIYYFFIELFLLIIGASLVTLALFIVLLTKLLTCMLYSLLFLWKNVHVIFLLSHFDRISACWDLRTIQELSLTLVSSYKN